MSCTRCSLWGACINPCLQGKGITNTEVMVIGDYVHYAEDSVGEPFVGTGGRTLVQELMNAGIDPSLCYLTKAVKCYPPGDRAPKQSEIKACKANLEEEVDRIKPKYILIVGSAALKATLGKTSITAERGKVYDWKGAKCMATFAPGAVVRQPNLLHTWRADIHYFSRLLDGEIKEPADFKWRVVEDAHDVIDLMNDAAREAKEEGIIAYDIETTALYDMDNEKLLMLGVATEKCSWVINLEFPGVPKSPISKNHLETLLTTPKLKRVAHNGKFDNRWLRSRGIRALLDFDTYLASYCLNVTLPHDLKYLSKVHCGAGDYAVDTKNLLSMPFRVVAKYCALDTYYTRKLYKILKAELLKDQGIARVFSQIVMPGARVLEKLEERGAYINLDKLIQVRDKFVKEMLELEADMERMIGKTINWNSTQQLAEVLFRQLGLTQIAGESTAKSVLLRLAPLHPFPKKVLEYRRYSKALSAFLNPWIEMLEHEKKMGRETRIHTTYNIAKTATGRLSSEKPNLQQVPRLKDIRNLVSAPPGRVVVEADFSQIELRVAAFIAGAESMKKIYRAGGDIHTATGCEVSGVTPDKLSKEQRTAAKAVNFGFLYGMWWRSFKDYAFDSYGVEYTDLQAMHARERYFQKYYELPMWHKRQVNEVRTFKGVRSPIGRFRHLPNIDSPDRDLRSEAERQAINTPVQSMASDMTILAMIEVDKILDPNRAAIFGQVHDSILIEADEDYAEDVARMVKECMEKKVDEILRKIFGVKLDIPIVADVKIGQAWGAGDEWAEANPFEELDYNPFWDEVPQEF